MVSRSPIASSTVSRESSRRRCGPRFTQLVGALALCALLLAATLGPPPRAWAEQSAPDLVGESLKAVVGYGLLDITWRVHNQGTAQADGPWTDLLYISPAATCCAGATLVGGAVWPAGLPIPAGEGYERTGLLSILSLPLGDYYLILKVNALGNLDEANESNNVLSAPFQITPHVDLYASALSAPPTASTQQSITVTWTVTNLPVSPFPEPATVALWQDNVYISPTRTCCEGATFLGSRPHVGGLLLNEYYTETLSVVIPNLPAGDYYIVVAADAANAQGESSEQNLHTAPITVTTPDLVPRNVKGPLTASTQQSITVSWNVYNQGTGPALAPWEDSMYLSPVAACCDSAILLGTWPRTLGVADGTSYPSTRTVTVPNLPAGSYHLFISTNDRRTLHEADELNNRVSIPLTVTTPDLTPTALSAPATVVVGQAVTASWTVKNQGSGPTVRSWKDTLYVSTTAVCCANAVVLGAWDHGVVPGGSSYAQTKSVTLPGLPAGDYYLLVHVDADGDLHEANDSNNQRAVPIRVTTADLTPTGLTSPASAVTQQAISVSWTVRNQGSGPATGGWVDQLYLSPTPSCCASAISIGQWTPAAPLAAGATYTLTRSVTVPSVSPGTYYLALRTDAAGTLGEASETNNEQFVAINVTTPDLVPTTFTAPATAEAGHTVSLSWTVRNQGTGATTGSWSDKVHLSATAACCAGTTSLGSWPRPATLSPGASYSRTKSVTLPPLASGSYYLTVVTDADGQLHETSDANNQRAVSIAVTSTSVPPPAGLAIASVNGGNDPTAGASFAVVVEARDLAGIPRPVVSATSIRLGLKSGTGALAGTLSATIPAGASQVTMGGITYKKAEAGVVVTASRTTGSALSSGDSLSFTVRPGATATYAVSLISPRPAGAVFDVAVTARDAFANTVTTDSSTSVTLRSASGHVLLDANGDGAFGDATKMLASGVLVMSARGTTAETTSIIASDGAGKTGSTSLTVTAGAPSVLAFTKQPGSAAAGAVIPGPPTVTVQDAFGNTTATSTVPITMALGPGPGNGALGGTLTRSATAGVATFTNLTISEAGSYRLTASAAGLTEVTSSAFVITAVTGTVSGRITRATDGAPLGAAVIRALQAGLVKASSVSDNDGTYAMAGLATGSYDVRASAVGYQPQTRSGHSVVAGAVSTANFTLLPTGGPTVRITSPAPGTTLDRPVVLVRGEVAAPAGTDVGVTVNGTPALLGGGRFAAFVALEPGAQQISAVLASSTVALAQDSVSVQVIPQSGTAKILLTASPRVGAAPLGVVLRATALVPVTEYRWDVDSDGIIDRAGPSFPEVSVQYLTPGLYFAEVTVIDTQGRATEVVPVLAVEQAAVLATLEDKWRDLKDRLRVGNISGALELIVQGRRDHFRHIFQNLTVPLAQIDQVLTDVRFVQIRDTTVEFEMLRTDERGRLSYLVRFALDQDGIWRIKDF